MGYGETIITERFYQEHFNDKDEVTTETHNFNIAFGFVGFGESDYDGDISQYGHVSAFYKRWGHPEDGPGTTYHKIETRPCTKEELGLTDDQSKSKFWAIKESNRAFLNDYYDRLFCFDDDQNLAVRGSFNSGSAQGLSIQFVACDFKNNSTCKSHQEIQ